MYHTSDGSSFTSISTYLQNKSSGCLSSKPQGVRVRASHMPSHKHLSSDRVTVRPQFSMGILPLPWQPVGLELIDGKPLCPLWAHLLSILFWLFPWICVAIQGQTFISKTASKNHTVLLSFGKEYMWVRPIFQIDWSLITRKKWGRTQHGKPLYVKGHLAQGKYLLSCALIPISWHFSGNVFQSGF